MTDVAFQNLEEKVMKVVANYEQVCAELTSTRSQLQTVTAENVSLKQKCDTLNQQCESLKAQCDKMNQQTDSYIRKLTDLGNLLDSVDGVPSETTQSDNVVVSPTLLAMKPQLVGNQG